jgi:succinate dehydrogenase / fumarate reductase, membrane anchor subunit
MTTATVTRERKANRAASVWMTQAISGLLLIVILTIHMIAHHFVVEGGLRDYEQVLAYVQNPLVFALELVFIVVATVHALLGVRAVILDIGLSEGAKRTLNWTLTIIGAITLVYGIWLAISLQQL